MGVGISRRASRCSRGSRQHRHVPAPTFLHLWPGGLGPPACEQPALQRCGGQAACPPGRRPQDSRTSGQVWDNPVLGAWVHRLRRDYRKNTLPQWQVDLLDRLDFAWKVDVHSAKWHHNLHEARRYKVRRRSCVGGGLFMLLHMGPVLGQSSPRDSWASLRIPNGDRV